MSEGTDWLPGEPLFMDDDVCVRPIFQVLVDWHVPMASFWCRACDVLWGEDDAATLREQCWCCGALCENPVLSSHERDVRYKLMRKPQLNGW